MRGNGCYLGSGTLAVASGQISDSVTLYSSCITVGYYKIKGNIDYLVLFWLFIDIINRVLIDY